MKFEEALNIINEVGSFEFGYIDNKLHYDESDTDKHGAVTYQGNGIPNRGTRVILNAVLKYLKQYKPLIHRKIKSEYNLDTADVVMMHNGTAKVTTDDGKEIITVTEKQYEPFLKN